MKKAAKISLWTGGTVLFLLLAVTVFCCAFVVRDPKIAPAELTDMDYFAGAKISQNVLYRALKSKNHDELRSINIRNSEMSSLMNLAENGESLLYLIFGRKPQYQQEKNDTYKVAYDRGIYTFKVKLTDSWCGLCFVASGSAKVKYNNGKTEIQFLSLKLGRTELPLKYKEKVREHIYEYLNDNSVYDVVRAAVLRVDEQSNGDLRIYYYPYRLRKYISNKMF